MNVPKTYLTAMIGLLAASCADSLPEPETVPPIVIEGWIEDGAHPIVMVTHAVDLNSETDNFDSCVEKWARVTVDDGERRVLLFARIDRDYFPPLVYTTNDITGAVGKTYTLTVETENRTVRATTSIPQITRLQKLTAEQILESDSLYILTAKVNVTAESEGYYKFLTKVNSDEKRYYSSFLGTFKSADYNPADGWRVRKGIHNTHSGHYSPHYHYGDTVAVKFCTMDSAAYAYWTAYENVVSTGSNQFFPQQTACQGNLSEGGRGYWFGYGVSFGRIIIK